MEYKKATLEVFNIFTHWLLVCVVYYVAKHFARLPSRKLDFFGQFKMYAMVLVITALIAVYRWDSYGTHREGYYDPAPHGDDETYTVVDFVPTPDQRNAHGLKVFTLLLIPGIVGTYRGIKELPHDLRD